MIELVLSVVDWCHMTEPVLDKSESITATEVNESVQCHVFNVMFENKMDHFTESGQ